jgi:uncharacterized protein
MAGANDIRIQTKTSQPWPAVFAGFALALIAATGAAAQSFDCGAARTKVEKTICSDKGLGDQDAALDTLYHATLDSAVAPDKLVIEQRTWMKTRDKCANAACLSALYTARTTVLGQAPKAAWQTYRNAKLGFSFDYLGNRTVGPCHNEPGPTCVALSGRDGGSKKELIEIKAVDGDLAKAAQDAAVFDLQDGKWIANAGPGSPQEATTFSGKGWTGINATLTCGISDKETGFHAGGGDCFWAVLSNGKRSVIIDSDGTTSNDAMTAKTVASIRFEP